MKRVDYIDIARHLLPERLKSIVTGFFYGWHGNYPAWKAAQDKCSGYDTADILEQVKMSAMLVKQGKAAYERDSFLFQDIQYSFPLLSSLMWIAARNGGNLNVMDFGGSLGSTYFQNRIFLDSIAEVNWCIVEQPEFIKAGRTDFENDRLHFFYNIEDCCKSFDIHVALFSSVLQYIEEPFKLLDNLNLKGIKYLLIDRTPFIKGKDRITVQKVNPRIYRGSYPCWFFNKDKFISFLSNDYDLVMEFDALDKANISSEFKGFLCSRKEIQ